MAIALLAIIIALNSILISLIIIWVLVWGINKVLDIILNEKVKG